MKPLAGRPQRSILLGAFMTLAAIVWMAGVALAGTQGVRLRYVPNEYIIHVQPGTSPADVQAQVSRLGAGVVKALLLRDMYLIRVGSTVQTATRTATARNAAATRWTIDRIQPNYRYYPCAIPNDPYWDRLWGMRMINAPKAWDKEKGNSSVTVAVLDTGCAPHPDIAARLLPGKDFVDATQLDGQLDQNGHGTHVAGTIAAQGDNGMGVCGVCWDNVMILPVRVLGPEGGDDAGIADGLLWAMQQGAQVVNMSLGGPGGVSPALHQAITELDSAGIILVAAAGNDAGPTGYPAALPECISVAALGPNESPAVYSDYGKIDIAAPGGDDRFGVDAQIYSTWVEGLTETPPLAAYSINGIQGTSMACPHVAGVAALLLSRGVPANQVRERLTSTARPPKTGAMDPTRYGAGIVDLYAAVSNASLRIIKPAKGSTVTNSPEFKITVKGIDPLSLRVFLDYPDNNDDGIPDDLNNFSSVVIDATNVATYMNAANTTLDFKWPLPGFGVLTQGPHKVYVSGNSIEGADAYSDWCFFRVSNRVIKAGIHLFAFPYSFLDPFTGLTTVAPSDLLTEVGTANKVAFSKSGSNRATLLRWLPATSVVRSVPYFQYFDGTTALKTTAEKLCWDNPWDSGFYTGGGYSTGNPSVTKFPVGSGFWLYLPRDAQIDESYTTLPADDAFNVYIYAGWNMIGNPYDRQVAWGNTLFTYRGDGPKTLLEAEAAGWVTSNLFGWNSDAGRYVSVTAKDLLNPFSGYWLRANVGSRTAGDQLILTVLP